MPRDDDSALLSRVAGGDLEAFEVLYRRFHARVSGYVFRVCRRADLVEEVVGDVMLAIWRSAGRFDGRSRPSTWIFGIAYRKTLKGLARHRQRTEPLETAPEPGIDGGAEARVARRELRGSITAALGRLSPDQRAVVDLAYFEDLSCAEIAEIVGAPVNTVKTRLFHARRRLRELLPELGVDGAEAM